MMNSVDIVAQTIVEIPFNLSQNIKWILELIIPMILAILGWILVYILNYKNLKKEKKILIKMQAYEHIKSDINNVIQSYGLANNTVFLTSSILADFSKENILYDINKKSLYEQQDTNSIKSLYNIAHNDFVKFIFSWETYEIVFKDLVRERYALQIEHQEILLKFSNVVSEYENYINYLRYDLAEYDKTTNIELKVQLDEMLDAYTDFNACIRDVSHDIQNFVFKDVINQKNERRKVKDPKFLTIDTLIKKHMKMIDSYLK